MNTRVTAIAAAFLAPIVVLIVLLSLPSQAAPLDVPPTVTGVAPNPAINDHTTLLTITGTGFAVVLSGTQVISLPAVSVGATPLAEVGWVSSATLTATLPMGFPIGIYTVTVTNPDGQSGSLPDGLTVRYPAPALQEVSPTNGIYGQVIVLTITGTSFVATPTVVLGSLPCAAVGYVSSTLLTATVPGDLPPGVYDLTVRNPGPGNPEVRLTQAFTLYSPIPTVAAIDPTSAPNDLDALVIITGTNFAPTPTAMLGAVPLQNATWVSMTQLTALVPWGMDPGTYALTVTNPAPGAASATLSQAFTVTRGIGQWNAGSLFGGEVNQLLIKPGNPNTLYAAADGINGLFRTQDAGEHWTHVSDAVSINNGKFAIDPLHPGWLYGYAPDGLWRSQDEGDTWTKVRSNTWPDGRSMNFPYVFVSPHDPQVLFVGSSESYGVPSASGAFGLIKSTDGGAMWQIVTNMEGFKVQDVAFDPTDPLHLKMILATSDAQVFQSSDGGDHWSEVTTHLPLTLTSLGMGGAITYNPYKPGEVWLSSRATPGGIYKSMDAALTNWQDVTPAHGGGWPVTFTSADSVYIPRLHSIDGGLTWQPFGPSPWYGYGTVIFDPDNPQIGYIGDNTVGVQKTTDGGQTWEVKNHGLTGMRCTSMDVSRVDPLRVYATFNGWPGIYRSNDGAANWAYLPITGSGNLWRVREDPFDPQRLYVAAGSFYVSTDGGKSWSALGWNTPPSPPTGGPNAMEPDPYQAGHLLVGIVSGTYGIGTGWLYSSTDYGVSWQKVTMPQELAWIENIAFDPETPGLVYLTTAGTGVYRSTDSGTSWERIDDLQQPEMQSTGGIAIATHPRRMLLVGAAPYPYRSLDGGATWERAKSSPGVSAYLFANGDSTRLYGATWRGLFFSSDAGDSWTQAAGVIGRVQVTNLGYGGATDHTIIYAATPGGNAGATSSMVVDTPQESLATQSNLVEAGIYRYVQRTRQTFLPVVQR